MSETSMIIIQTECTLYFEENKYAVETISSLAQRLGRKTEDLCTALEKLVTMSILNKTGSGDYVYYQYRQPDVVEGWLQWNEN